MNDSIETKQTINQCSVDFVHLSTLGGYCPRSGKKVLKNHKHFIQNLVGTFFNGGSRVFVFMSKLFRHKIVTNFVSISDGHIPLTNDSS